MACSSTDLGQQGFATSAAMMVSMGLAMTAAALITTSVGELKRARSDHARLEAEYTLAGVQRAAVAEILNQRAAGRLAWSIDSALGPARVLAEAEYDKASVATAAKDEARVLPRMGIGDAGALQHRLEAADASLVTQAWLERQDQARLWRTCAPSMISRFGRADSLALTPATAPDHQGFAWRGGEVWRVRAVLDSGWVDDRIVRFTGDALAPMATIERRFSRVGGEDRACDALIAKVQ